MALTITNHDQAEHMVTINIGKDAEEVKLKVGPGESISQNCPNRCSVRIEAKGSRYILASADDVLMIKGSKLLHDRSGENPGRQGGEEMPEKSTE